MTNTVSYQKSALPELSLRQLDLATEEAYSIIKGVKDLYKIKAFAEVIVDSFQTSLADDQRYTLEERIKLAIKASRVDKAAYDLEGWQRQCADNLARQALSAAALVVKHRKTRSNTIAEINRIVEGRNKRNQQSNSATTSFNREPRDGRRGSSKSEKSRPQRRNKHTRGKATQPKHYALSIPRAGKAA